MPGRTRLLLSLALGMLAGIVSHMFRVLYPSKSDFSLLRTAAEALVKGRDPYAVVLGLTYPLPGLLTVSPWTVIPEPLVNALFMMLSGSVFAWALMEHGYGPLLGFFTPGMLFAAQAGQWSPMFAGAIALAPLGVVFILKPHVGLAAFLARPSRWPVVSAIVCTALAFALRPTWISDWRSSLALAGAHLGAGQGSYPYLAPVTLPGGLLIPTALLRWRRAEARLLVALACVPQSLLLYEIVPLALVPRGWRQAGVYLVLSHVVWRILGREYGWPTRVEYVMASGTLYTLLIFLPLTAMVLTRANTGVLPARLERAIAGWPDWLRGEGAAG